MKILLAKRGHALVAADEAAEKLQRGMEDGECLMFEFIKCRSIQWHRMYFGMCREIGLNQDPQRSENSIDPEVRVLAGHYDVLYVDGHEVRVPKRIAFGELTAAEWAELWPSLELAIREKFGEEYVNTQRMAG